MMLDVYVSNRLVGVLDQPDPYTYVFNYLPDAPSELAVSLLMPKRTESWISRELHPVFQISLPEGALRELITRKLGKRFKHFGDLELLSVVGENMIGRIQVTSHGKAPSNSTPHESLSRLMNEETHELVQHYLGARLHESGVSGGFMKFLAKSPSDNPNARPTLALNDWIVKLNDDDHPHIVLLEYFGMMAARAAGLTLPDVHLSQDRKHLLVKRFDVTTTGERLGFEDMCALFGLPARDKFTGSVERILRTMSAYCQAEKKKKSFDQFFGQYLLASTMRNGDAHLKNFGLIYEGINTAELAPVYDMLSMSVYAPILSNSRDANDAMAINFQGSKRWLTPDSIDSLAAQCLITRTRVDQWKSQIADALIKTSSKVLDHLNTHPEDNFEPIASRMLELWAIGLATLDHEAAQSIRSIRPSKG
jgi:serine/threonine-protein kinase HipA